MALIAYQSQGSCSTLHYRPQLWSVKPKSNSLIAAPFVRRSDKLVLSYRHQWRIQPVTLRKGRSFKVSSFKGNSHNEETKPSDRGCSLSKKTAGHLSYTQQEKDEAITESSDITKHKVPFVSKDKEGTITGSPAIQRLFRKWLVLLRTQTSNLSGDVIHEERTEHSRTVVAPRETNHSVTTNLLKAAFLHLWALDATMKIPLLIFPPCYVAIRLAYGVDVAQELMPLWILGPLIVALYIMMIRGLCFLYAFCFQQTTKLLINLPSYYQLLSNYISEGKLDALLQKRLWQPISDFKNTSYKEFLMQKLKQLKEWAIEKQLDYIESVWPFYCRTIRFLKKANLI